MDNGKTISSPVVKPISRSQLITLEDLDDFKKELLASIQVLLARQKDAKPKKWLKTYEVKKLLGISSGTLQTLRNNGTIPFSRIGGIIYYDLDEVNKAMEERKMDINKYLNRTR